MGRRYVLAIELTEVCRVSIKACLTILLEQKAFLDKVFKIPFEERSWKKLVNLDTLHAYCGGPTPTEEA